MAPTPFLDGDSNIHTVGDHDCQTCWPGYPQLCDNGDCPGLIHAAFLEEDWDNVFLTTPLCDLEDAEPLPPAVTAKWVGDHHWPSVPPL